MFGLPRLHQLLVMQNMNPLLRRLWEDQHQVSVQAKCQIPPANSFPSCPSLSHSCVLELPLNSDSGQQLLAFTVSQGRNPKHQPASGKESFFPEPGTSDGPRVSHAMNMLGVWGVSSTEFSSTLLQFLPVSAVRAPNIESQTWKSPCFLKSFGSPR